MSPKAYFKLGFGLDEWGTCDLNPRNTISKVFKLMLAIV
jgi:hypothetical protein